MPMQVILTNDGSHSIAVGDGLTYHSVFGAIRESRHIFIGAGLTPLIASGSGPLQIFELGFGTGLNALLTWIVAAHAGRPVYYETIDIEPLAPDLVAQLNYCARLMRPDLQPVFEKMHTSPWGQETAITPEFSLFKGVADGARYRPSRKTDLVYFDAFDPAVQPQLWTEPVFARLAAAMAPGAVLVTYSCKGAVRRALQAAGLVVEKLPGPPGKREFLRARRAPHENE